MNQKTWKIIAAVMLVAVLAVCALSVTAGPCSKMLECNGMPMHMRCFWSYKSVTVLSAVAALFSVVSIACKTKEGRLVALAAVIVSAAVAAFMLSSAGIGTCGGAEMACNVHALPIYVLIAIAVVVAIVLAAKADPAQADRPKMSL